MPKASKAFHALVHVINANPALLKLSDDSSIKLPIPNLKHKHNYLNSLGNNITYIFNLIISSSSAGFNLEFIGSSIYCT